MMPSFRLEDDTLFFQDGRQISVYSSEAFELMTEIWLKVGWNLRYHYSFTWMGAPALQLPEDMLRLQEVMYQKKPDVIIECGIARGGSLLFYASICQLMGKGRVIGIDIDLRPMHRPVLESNPLITLIDGDSTQVPIQIKEGEQVMVILDSNHSRDHVLKELNRFASIVSPGQYLVVADGFKKYLADVPRGKKEWAWDNPIDAIDLFLKDHPEFKQEEPTPLFCKTFNLPMTHLQKGWLIKS